MCKINADNTFVRHKINGSPLEVDFLGLSVQVLPVRSPTSYQIRIVLVSVALGSSLRLHRDESVIVYGVDW